MILFQIKEEDESKASSRNSIDKAAASSPSTSIRVVDNTTPASMSGAASPAVSGRQVIQINKEQEQEQQDIRSKKSFLLF